MERKAVRLFVEELTELSRKYGLVIGGCGCCGSPDVSDMPEAERDGQYKIDIGTYANSNQLVTSCLEWVSEQDEGGE